MHGADVAVCAVENTDSMLPTFDANAILLAEKVEFGALREGDIVTYKSRSGKLIVHRLNDRRPKGWWPVGDNNRTADPELVTPENLDRRVIGILYGAKDATTDN
jgi:signal peptidase I